VLHFLAPVDPTSDRQSESRMINFILSCISQNQNRNLAGFSNNFTGMTDAQQVGVKRLLIVIVIVGAVVLFGIWYRNNG
jgi:hypothetical protein